jgi:GNAT superfamily N-acetyltransferase
MIRRASLSDLALVLNWAADEGWNPGLDDATAFLAADAGGFFVAEKNGRAVAAISVVNHDAEFAFLGLYLCHPDYRGQGIGFALWTHALGHAETRTVGLDGVAAQQANYAKSGFRPSGATLRVQGSISTPAPSLREADTTDINALAALDRAANGYGRAAFLTAWTTPAPTRRTIVIDRPDGVSGFATARLCREGCKIGPLIAPDTATAVTLLQAAAGRTGEDRITVDVPEANGALLARLSSLGFTETFRTARMYRGPAPVTGPMLQAIGTMELG